MNTQSNSRTQYQPKSWREWNVEPERNVQWRKFLAKYQDERIAKVFAERGHHDKAAWERLLGMVNIRGLQTHRNSYI